MKKYTSFIYFIILLTACSEDFTQLSPISQRNVGNFFSNAADFEIAVDGAYDGLQLDGTYGRTYLLLMEMRSDNANNAGGQSGLSASMEEIDQFREIATATELQTAWSDSYEAIARCNAILTQIEGVDFDQEQKDQFMGETLFIRSLLYYNLAVVYGNVPLQLSIVSNPEEIEIDQVTSEAIYTQIIGDLTTAMELLPAGYTGEDIGRATSGSAAALLGKVYLTTGNYAEAETTLRGLVNTQEYSLLPNYADLWGAANENNAESVFEIQYKGGGQGEGSGYFEYFAQQLGRSGGVGGGNTPMGVTDDLIAAYEPGDLRFDATIFTNGDDTTYVKKYISEQITPFDGENNWVVIRYADVLLMLAEALGETPESYDLINQVRARAGLPAISAATAGTFEEKLLHERRVELAFENQRWTDLLRFGMAPDMMAEQLDIPESQVSLIYPIPQREIDVASGQLLQNP
ncbi:MAG: RagB/SusD family nutrient uptake outer membrane protein [Cyclobacteriaceae bacterium]